MVEIQYLKDFKRFPGRDSWLFGPVKCFGTTYKDPGDCLWRCLVVVVPTTDERGMPRNCSPDLTDALYFRKHFFGDSDNVVLWMPKAAQTLFTLIFWSNSQGMTVPGKDGEPSFGSVIDVA